jgi:serine/threonine protein kinase
MTPSQVDIYSFGVLLLEMIISQRAVRGFRSDHIKLAESCAPREIFDLILSCLKRDPADRPSALDIRSSIAQWSASTPSPLCPRFTVLKSHRTRSKPLVLDKLVVPLLFFML